MVNKWMKKNVTINNNNNVKKVITTQSIKRGAVTTLMKFAAQGKLPLDIISRLAKHRHWFDPVSETTIQYVGEEAIDSLALALNTHEATRLLQ
jgi:hypothetical protein